MHRVAKVSEIIVPVFAGLYILVALAIVVMNITEIPSVIALIVESALILKEWRLVHLWEL
nr:alanine:cation symporter family protein [Clostridioides difficile]